MSNNAACLLKAIQKQEAVKEASKAIENVEQLIKIAAKRGYSFTAEQMKNEINKLSLEELASIVNPGIGPRHHLLAR
ncbi:MAG: Nif11 family protein [Oscillatoria sp. SIO1A7]|nr:Nif11 family protein [Oscillatoria sp. SIO1A7]